MTHNPSDPDHRDHPEQDPQEPQEGMRFTDKRRIDPETGEVRDAVSQAEQIINDAAQATNSEETSGAEQPAEDSAVAEELRNDLQRLQAEYVNYRRRVERDRNVAKDNAINSVIEALLPVFDDLDAARQAGDLEDGPFAAIANKLDNILSGFGLIRHDQEALAGVEFDPNQHEAMLRQASTEVPAEHIVQVFRNGYLREDRVLRAAQVMVSAGDE